MSGRSVLNTLTHMMARVPLELRTRLGPVDALEFGDSNGPLIVAIQGKSANLDVITEWEPAAASLAELGYHVVLPNLHSNERTKPGVVASEDVQHIVCGICERYAATSLVVMGKSWGGGEAVKFTAAHNEMVDALVLVAPSLSPLSLIQEVVDVPTALFWARDDPVKTFDLAAKYTSAMSDVAFHEVATGGHRILDGYISCIRADIARVVPPPREPAAQAPAANVAGSLDAAFPLLSEHIRHRGGRLCINAFRWSYDSCWLVTFNSAGARGRGCSPFSPAPVVIKLSDEAPSYGVEDALRDVEACLVWVEKQGTGEADLTLGYGEYLEEVHRERGSSTLGVQTCRDGASPLTTLDADDAPVEVPCTGSYCDFSLGARFPHVAALPLLRPKTLTQAEATAAINRELERMMRGEPEDEESEVRRGPKIPEASRGFVVGGSPELDDPPVVLIAAGEVSWYCDNDAAEGLPSMHELFDKLEAHLGKS